MKHYKNYTQNRNVYTLKQVNFANIVSILFSIFLIYAAFGLANPDNPKARLFLLALGIAALIWSVVRMNGKFIIDKDRNKFIIKKHMLSAAKEIPIDSFSHFEETKVVQLGSFLHKHMVAIFFEHNNKEIAYTIKQTLGSSKPVKKAIEETVEIAELEQYFTSPTTDTSL